jgi:hypothetical protein
MFRNSGGVGRTPRCTMFRNSGGQVSSNVRDIKKRFSVLIDLLIITKISISSISIARARARRASAVVASAGHDGRGLRHAAPLGAGILAARMGPAHQNSDRRASSDALLALSRRGGRYTARSKAQQEQLQRYRAAPAEPCYELHTCSGGAKIPTSHRRMFFCGLERAM